MAGNKRKRTGVGNPRGKGWLPGRKAQGGEGLSKGYGGSTGSGTNEPGPERRRQKRKTRAPAPRDNVRRDGGYSASLPSRERIAKVLR